MEINNLSKPLEINQIDFRIQSINKGGYATILAYKDARADMNRLDEVCGALNWKREHLNNNANCKVSIWNAAIKEWVSKEDTGTESMAEKAKGLASDSFKRACFNWGIGRELYDYPIIKIKLNDDEFKDEGGKVKPTWKLKIKEWKWFSKFENDKLIYLACNDEKGNPRFNWGNNNKPKISKTELEDSLLNGSLEHLRSLIKKFDIDENEMKLITNRANEIKNK